MSLRIAATPPAEGKKAEDPLPPQEGKLPGDPKQTQVPVWAPSMPPSRVPVGLRGRVAPLPPPTRAPVPGPQLPPRPPQQGPRVPVGRGHGK